MFINDIPRRDWLLLAALACAGPFVYVEALFYSAIAGGYVLERSGVGPGFPATAVLSALGALGTTLAALLLLLPITRFARSPLPLAAALAALVPLILAVGIWLEFNKSVSSLLQLLGIQAIAFALTCVAIGYRASRLRLKAE